MESSNISIQELNERVQKASLWVSPLKTEMQRVIVGQESLIHRLTVALLANGHVLLEGVPGLAKTLALNTLAKAIKSEFKRIQFTPDMLPADIVGTEIYNPKDVKFIIKNGPVFTNFVLADEINRAPAKVQSALLEAMQERQVTIGENTFKLPDPFLVMATQNPIEQEGTYPLPEAQVDRFMLKVIITHPTPQEERLILDRMGTSEAKIEVNPVMSAEDIVKSRGVVNQIFMDDKIKDYVVSIIHATRDPEAHGLKIKDFILNGSSPRGTISLTLASRASAFINGRGFVTPEDVKMIAMDVLRHRVTVSYEAEAEGITSEDLVTQILDTLPVP
ncbi:MAG: MoxR family ATPase [Opitutales bacterium]|nr:MoxR family ATPase [Opitutales bacterium]